MQRPIIHWDSYGISAEYNVISTLTHIASTVCSTPKLCRTYQEHLWIVLHSITEVQIPNMCLKLDVR